MDKPKDRTFAVLDREVQDLLRVSYSRKSVCPERCSLEDKVFIGKRSP